MAPRTITKADRVSVYITAVRPPEILSYIQKPHINPFKWPDAVEVVCFIILLSLTPDDRRKTVATQWVNNQNIT